MGQLVCFRRQHFMLQISKQVSVVTFYSINGFSQGLGEKLLGRAVCDKRSARAAGDTLKIFVSFSFFKTGMVAHQPNQLQGKKQTSEMMSPTVGTLSFAHAGRCLGPAAVENKVCQCLNRPQFSGRAFACSRSWFSSWPLQRKRLKA